MPDRSRSRSDEGRTLDGVHERGREAVLVDVGVVVALPRSERVRLRLLRLRERTSAAPIVLCCAGVIRIVV